MLISITHTRLSESHKNLLAASCSASEAVAIVFGGDGVYSLQPNENIIEKCLSISTEETTECDLCFYAVAEDVFSRGVNVDQNITQITNQELAALAAAHKQWVTL
jgi:sulfur relay protein TusB/DsrH